MRKVIAALLGLALGGCNMVVSERPWFAAADALQPGLKDGLWVNLKDAKCRFDPAQAIQDWPDCAQPMLVQGGYYRGPGPGQDDPGQLPDVEKWEQLGHVLAAGEPAIDQIDLSSVDEPDAAKPTKGYLYLATRITARDAQDRVVEVVRWPVACGPLPKRKNIVALLRETIFQQESPLVDTDASNKAMDADAALQELGSDQVAFGYVTATVTVMDADTTAADEKLRQPTNRQAPPPAPAGRPVRNRGPSPSTPAFARCAPTPGPGWPHR